MINSLIAKGLNGEVRLLDQGEAKRTYCYVTDAVEILWHILFHGTDPVYNVGGTSKTTIRELALAIGQRLNVPVVFPEQTPEDVEESTKGAPEDVCLDMTKVEQEFGKRQYVQFSNGLDKTIAWQKVLCKKFS